jgi:hypothetical protein
VIESHTGCHTYQGVRPMVSIQVKSECFLYEVGSEAEASLTPLDEIKAWISLRSKETTDGRGNRIVSEY